MSCKEGKGVRRGRRKEEEGEGLTNSPTPSSLFRPIESGGGEGGRKEKK